MNSNDGRGGIPPTMPAWQPLPPTQMQPQMPPPTFAPPFRAPDPPRTPIDAAHEVVLPRAMQAPPRCACCFANAETSLPTRGVAARGRTTESRTINVPYCSACAQHIGGATRRGVSIGLVATALGIAAPFALIAAWDYVPAPLQLAIGCVVALGVVIALERVWKIAPIAYERGCTTASRPALRIAGFAFHGPTTTVHATNEQFADALAAMHRTSRRQIVSRPRLGARYIVAPLVAAIAGVPAFFATHGHVYIDNGSNAAVTIDIDDGARTVSLVAAGRDDLYLPVGEANFDVAVNGATAETFDATVNPFGIHVATPFGAGCYGTIERAYGTASIEGPSFVAEPPGLRWHTLHGVDYVFDPFPRTVSVKYATGATRRRFARIDCTTGVAQ